MRNYFRHVFLFLKRFLWLLILYSISRLFFYLLNAAYFSGTTTWQLIVAFLAGIRFDIAAIAFTNAPFLFLLLPGDYKNKVYVQKTGDLLFFSINAIALMGNFIDARFFEFINKRSTSSIFSLMGTNRDVWMMIPRILADYWYIALSWIVLMIVFWRWMPRLMPGRPVSEKLTVRISVAQISVFIAVLGIMFWGARGTRLKPVGIIDAAAYTSLKNVPLVLNTPFSILKTLENENLTEYSFFFDDSLKKYYTPFHKGTSGLYCSKSVNVVIIILESFSREYSGYLSGTKGYTPHFDSILKRSYIVSDAYANGTQSYEALPAIIAGIPSLMNRPYSGSNYSGNLIEGLPGLLGEAGYHTSFFHGGNNGTMGFNNFARIAGISHYFGRDEYNNDSDHDGHWGIWDEPFLLYFANRLSTFPEPFFSCVFTLSSHHPYNVPDKYSYRFPEDKLPILKSIGYTDYALGRFFEAASHMPWYNSTLFVLTADHAAQAVESKYNSTTGMYSIPLAFFCPSDTNLRGASGSAGQQIDVLPTVLDYLGYQKPFFAFGESVLDPGKPHRAISFVNNIYQLAEGDYVLLFNGSRATAFYKKGTLEVKKLTDSPEKIISPEEIKIFRQMEKTIKAIVQTYNYCLINNRTTFH